MISHAARWPRTRRFGEATSRPSGATKHWKNIYSGSQLFYLLARLDFLLTSKLLSVRKDGTGTTKSMGLTLEC